MGRRPGGSIEVDAAKERDGLGSCLAGVAKEGPKRVGIDGAYWLA